MVQKKESRDNPKDAKVTISGCGGYGARFDVLLIILIRKVAKSLSDKNSGKCRLVFKFF